MLSLLGVAARDSGQVYVHELREEWSDTGLRQSDFPIALNELTTNQLATLAVLGAEAVVQLTERGLKECRRPSVAFPHRFMDWLTLGRLRMRRTDLAGAKLRKRRRRIEDAATPKGEDLS